MTTGARLIGVTAAALVLASCASSSGSESGPEPRNHGATVLTTGTIGAMPYRLTVPTSPDGNLCMAVSDGQVPNSHRFAESGCGFGPPDAKGSAVIDVSEAGGVTLYGGPAPAGAVRVRLDSTTLPAQPPPDSSAISMPGCVAETPRSLSIAITHRLPSWATRGGWFVAHAREHGCGYLDAHFLDSAGKEIPESRW